MNVCTVQEYIQSKSELYDKICAINALIDAMILNSIDWISTGGTASYSMDDGQMKVTTNYRSIEEITMGIFSLEKTLQMYTNRYNGNLVVLRGKLNY